MAGSENPSPGAREGSDEANARALWVKMSNTQGLAPLLLRLVEHAESGALDWEVLKKLASDSQVRLQVSAALSSGLVMPHVSQEVRDRVAAKRAFLEGLVKGSYDPKKEYPDKSFAVRASRLSDAVVEYINKQGGSAPGGPALESGKVRLRHIIRYLVETGRISQETPDRDDIRGEAEALDIPVFGIKPAQLEKQGANVIEGLERQYGLTNDDYGVEIDIKNSTIRFTRKKVIEE